MTIPAEEFVVQSIYGANSRKPLVAVRLGDRFPMNVTPAKAREMAAMLLAAAEAAEADGFLFEFALNKLGAGEEGAAVLMAEYRQWRERQA